MAVTVAQLERVAESFDERDVKKIISTIGASTVLLSKTMFKLTEEIGTDAPATRELRHLVEYLEGREKVLKLLLRLKRLFKDQTEVLPEERSALEALSVDGRRELAAEERSIARRRAWYMFAQGYNRKEVAAELGLATGLVDEYRKRFERSLISQDIQRRRRIARRIMGNGKELRMEVGQLELSIPTFNRLHNLQIKTVKEIVDQGETTLTSMIGRRCTRELKSVVEELGLKLLP